MDKARIDKMNELSDDERWQPAREAIISAFNKIVLSQRYADIRVPDIVRRADTARSTFYSHFKDKDDLLRQSLAGVLKPLSNAIFKNADVQAIECVLIHFRENERLVTGMLATPAAKQVITTLSGLIQENLQELFQSNCSTSSIPLPIIAGQLAESQIGLIKTWLADGSKCPALIIANTLHASSIAVLSVSISSVSSHI